jgi:4a-hydroxytetrahydrobiopterin dehydratase
MTRPGRLEAADVDAALAASSSPWRREGDRLRLVRKFGSFREAIGFVVEVAFLAEAADHHPDLAVHYDEVNVELWTHSAGGLTQLDLDLAGRIAALGAAKGEADG